MTKSLFFVGLHCLTALAQAQTPPTIEDAVQSLVAEALDANLEMDGADAAVAQKMAALDQARASYLPSLDFSGRYSRATGGRTIDFPVGDLLNPVYATLNQLSHSNSFPAVQNQQINFQRRREQDTHVTLTQALYDSRLPAGRSAAQSQLDAASAGRRALAGQIERDMREAYYKWLQAGAQIAILDATLELTAENLRVNNSLFRNGKITRDLVYRSEADQLEVQQSLLAAHNSETLAKSYVNLLRNASFDRDLPLTTLTDQDVGRLRAAQSRLQLQSLQSAAVEHRAELRQLDALQAAAAAEERLAMSAFKPRLLFAMDAGIQGEGYAFNSDDRYLLASVVLKFNLFSGGGDRAGIASARAQMRQVRASRDLQEQQVRLQVQQALQNLDLASASQETAAKRVEAANAAFRIVSRKRDLGQINQAEYIDSRRAMTEAQLNLSITRFAALESIAELQYSLGDGHSPLPPESLP